jgi:hypothetical protein
VCQWRASQQKATPHVRFASEADKVSSLRLGLLHPQADTFRIEGFETSLNHAREIAIREELDAVGHYIEEAQGYLAQIRVLHEEALLEFSRAQGE